MKALISVFYFQKQRGRLREFVQGKEGCEEAKVRQEKWLREEKIEMEKFFKVCRIFIFMLALFVRILS